MITPRFQIQQDDQYILIDIKISHVRFNSANVEMVVEDNLFIFSLAPYYLRLRFPKLLVDDDRATAKLNSLTEEINIRIPKLNKGEVFEDLDLHAKLLARSNEIVNDEPMLKDIRTATTTLPKIGLIQELDVDHDLNKTIEHAEDFNWEIQQQEETETSQIEPTVKYGFNQQYDTIIGVSLTNGNDINELADPEHTDLEQRIMERLIKENIKFDHEYYAADYIMEIHPTEDDDKRVTELINWKSPTTATFQKFNKRQQQLRKEGQVVENFPSVEFSVLEQDQMVSLPHRTYLVDQPIYLHSTIISLLFAYNFDLRCNEGEHTTESGWTVGKLTPQIATLDMQLISLDSPERSLLKAVVMTSTRRALLYPLHRNFHLVTKVWEDVYFNLRCGKRLVLKSLLQIREFFRYHDVYYVYCKVLLDDLVSWFINDVGENLIRNLSHDLRQVTGVLKKEEVVFEKVLDDEMVALNLGEIELMANEMYVE